MTFITRSRQATLRAITVLTIVALLTSLLTSCNLGGSTSGPARDYWPTEGWRSTTPEAQGFDFGETGGRAAGHPG